MWSSRNLESNYTTGWMEAIRPRSMLHLVSAGPACYNAPMWQLQLRMTAAICRWMNAARRSAEEVRLARAVAVQQDEITDLRARIKMLEADARVANHEAELIAGELERIRHRGLADIAESTRRTGRQ